MVKTWEEKFETDLQEALEDPQSDEWLRQQRADVASPEKTAQGFDVYAAKQALSSVEDSLVAIQDEAYSLTGRDKQIILKAIESLSPGLRTLKQVLQRLR